MYRTVKNTIVGTVKNVYIYDVFRRFLVAAYRYHETIKYGSRHRAGLFKSTAFDLKKIGTDDLSLYRVLIKIIRNDRRTIVAIYVLLSCFRWKTTFWV